jgi:hypothetical protein
MAPGIAALALAVVLSGCGGRLGRADDAPLLPPTPPSPSPTAEPADPYGLDAVDAELDTVGRGTNQADLDMTDGDTAAEQDDTQ